MWSLINDHIRSDGELFWVQICALPFADLLKMQFRWISENSSFGYEALALGTTSQATHIELWLGGGGRNIVQRCGVEQVMRYWKYILGMLHTYNRLFWQKILYGQHTLIKYNSINIIKYNILWEKDNQSFEHNFPLTCLEPNHLTCFRLEGGRGVKRQSIFWAHFHFHWPGEPDKQFNSTSRVVVRSWSSWSTHVECYLLLPYFAP